MLLANVAWILASAGNRVLAIDWDLEAPGLHQYFHPFLIDRRLEATDGLIDMLIDYSTRAVTPLEKEGTDWLAHASDITRYVTSVVWPFPGLGAVHLMPAGRQNLSYSARINAFDWRDFYQRLNGGAFLDLVKREAQKKYDYMLIDSRTGVSDTSGICTVQMPDELVVCFTASEQSLSGGALVASSVKSQWQTARAAQEVGDNFRLQQRIFPVFTRVENSEKRKLDAARARVRELFNPIIELNPEAAEEYWRRAEVPYWSYYAFEEMLAVFADEYRANTSLITACENLTALLTDNKVTRLVLPAQEDRDRYLRAFTRGAFEGDLRAVSQALNERMLFEAPKPIEEFDSISVTHERISQELIAQTGFLDLGRLGLTSLPEELFRLTHLRRLNLGAGMYDNGGEWPQSSADVSPNRVELFLSALPALPKLEALSINGTDLANLIPLAGLTQLLELDCSGAQVGDLGPLAELSALQSLDCSHTQISDLAPLAELGALQSLDCSDTQISDLAPLAELSALQTLDCSDTQISDLAPLAELSDLQTLDCSDTQISDLAPLAELSALQTLDCSDTQISDLDPLAKLSALQTLDCSDTQISDLAPLAELSTLQWLNCSDTQISDLDPLAKLSALQSLDCSDTQISDLDPLAKLSALQSLDCSDTQISDLDPLAKLSALQSLDCSDTQISDLDPLAKLSALQTLDCSHCRLTDIPAGFWGKSSLQKVILYNADLPGVPPEVLSQSARDDCLESLRAHLLDLAEGAVVEPDVKLAVLGNGRVGKTQICRRLRGEDYDDTLPSTHGILVTSANLPATDTGKSAKLHIWDFGGQDIYHGTHALFMRARAVFLLVWTPERERSGELVYDGTLSRDYPLDYWLDYVRHLGEPNSPVLLVQARCDEPKDDQIRPPVSGEALARIPFHEIVHYSARFDRGRSTLDSALTHAEVWLTEQEGVLTIGAGRLRVKRRIEALRDEDALLPPEQRRYRTLSQERFRQLCDEAGGISSAEYLLEYLHNTGIVFYRRGLFDDRIILDQSWTLEAVYAVFNRQNCYRQIRQLGGRFTRPLLEALVWDGYSVEEQKLFLSMMESCGICFVHRHRSGDDEEDEYIAPDLLPERDEVQAEIAARWQPDQPVETAEFEYALLHPGIVRSVISRIGSQAGMSALYWRGGLCLYEQTTGSRALIEQHMDDAWGGTIRVQTQSGQAATLLEKLSALIEEESERTGSKPVKVTSTSPSQRNAVVEDAAAAAPGSDGPSRPPPMRFEQERQTRREYYVSYAWGDATLEGAEREKIVDRLCDAAEQRGIHVLRDKNALGLGEWISKFMQRMGRVDRVFVVLSDKYLKSPYCMFELLEVWRFSRGEKAEFIDRVRAYTLPGVQISTLLDRLQYAVYWTKRRDTVDSLVKQHGIRILGEDGMKEYFLMEDFVGRVSDILAMVADRLQPGDFEELEKHWLNDLQE
jgi:internalin A